jgi:DNA polymerase-3 subunit epsilon
MISDLRIEQTPFAVVDIETTGFSPGLDRIVEIAVVHVDPGGETRLVLDTLVHPRRTVGASAVHGIVDEDVAGAPSFADIAPAVNAALSGRVGVAHNAGFDLRFLKQELGADFEPPYLCTMELGAVVSGSEPLGLDDACISEGVARAASHAAAPDAMDTARLLAAYRQRLLRRGILSFGQLADLAPTAGFVVSFGKLPPIASAALPQVELRPRSKASGTQVLALRSYAAALTQVLGDAFASESEIAHLANLRSSLGISVEEARALHAQAFASAIMLFSFDRKIDEPERLWLHRLWLALASSGWAPGQ